MSERERKTSNYHKQLIFISQSLLFMKKKKQDNSSENNRIFFQCFLCCEIYGTDFSSCSYFGRLKMEWKEKFTQSVFWWGRIKLNFKQFTCLTYRTCSRCCRSESLTIPPSLRRKWNEIRRRNFLLIEKIFIW